jgi:isoleucyl-tRNA synthetase
MARRTQSNSHTNRKLKKTLSAPQPDTLTNRIGCLGSTMSNSSDSPYPQVPNRPDFPAIEERVLALWDKNKSFEESVANRLPDNEYVFYDGPPFANGLPHHGHLLTGFVKDVVPRYQTMRGKKVERRFGWDCHGLPAEMETEQELNVSGRAAITEFGIENFNAQCRESVLRYTSEWEETVTRQGRWVDFDDDYKTMDLSYMESVMWAFKQLWEKGLIYEAFRVMPYSWGAETPLSNFEIRLDDSTRPRQDPAVTVGFELESPLLGYESIQILAWTTTPWTLPSNLALAVGANIDYSIISSNDNNYLIGTETLSKYEVELGDYSVLKTAKGSELIGLRYKPLFSFFAERDDAFRILSADFIDTAEGTGVVHMAPGFGEDDQLVCESNGIPIGSVVPVDDKGCFTDEVADWAGLNVFDANPEIIKVLKNRNLILRHETYEHNYPHCWRTDTPIIYKAISSWYVKVTDIRDRLQDINQEINWVPGHVKDGRFGQWLAGARDWSISRNRFWGSPIPIWMSDDPNYPRTDVYGSLDEIERDFGTRPVDLHRPYIDDLTRPNPDDPTGKSIMRRVPEVLDCWFESGSMPFAQVHYPFENKEWFEDHFPADFIVEYINQTRGWFYTLHVLAGALFDKPAFQNVICHGILLAEDGNKLSKRHRNYTEPSQIFDRQGSDALRWYLMSTNIVRGGDTRISDSGIDDVTRQVLIPIWNAYSFFTLYANVDNYTASNRVDSTNVLDRYLLAKTRNLVEQTTAALDAYDLPGAASEIQSFIDALNNWYIRRSRDRFWGTGKEQPAIGDPDAYDTLYTVLTTLARVCAPFLPMIMEEIYGGLTGGKSVHLEDWPDPQHLPADNALVINMDKLRDAASTGLRLREDAGLRVRLPLNTATVAGKGAEDLSEISSLLAEEINVRRIILTNEISDHASMILKPNGEVLGPRLGKNVQKVFQAAKQGKWSRSDTGVVTIADESLQLGEYELLLEPVDPGTTAALKTNDVVVILDIDVTPELHAEGAARDLIRSIQQARKDSDLNVTDRIRVEIRWSPDNLIDIKTHADTISAAVLADSLNWLPGDLEPSVTVETTI